MNRDCHIHWLTRMDQCKLVRKQMIFLMALLQKLMEELSNKKKKKSWAQATVW